MADKKKDEITPKDAIKESFVYVGFPLFFLAIFFISFFAGRFQFGGIQNFFNHFLSHIPWSGIFRLGIIILAIWFVLVVLLGTKEDKSKKKTK